MDPNLLPEARISPLERLESAVAAMTSAQEENTKILKGIEPVMEALIASYLQGTKEVQSAISSIEEYVSKIEPVAVNQEAVAAIGKLQKTFSNPNLFKIPEPTVITESKETVRAIKDLIRTVELKPMEVNLSNDFTKLEKALGRIEKLVKFEVPLDSGRVAVKLSDEDLKKIGAGFSFPLSIGTASEDTLQLINSKLDQFTFVDGVLQTTAGSGGGTGGLTNTELRASPVPVSGDFYPATQPISAASLPLPTGAATAARQDLLLAELQLKADLTDTQPVSLASVPSHHVTNAGTFAVQATLAAETTKVIGTVNIAGSQTLGTVTTVGTVTNITNQGNLVDDAAFTPATTRVMMSGYHADENATDSVDEGDGGAARMTLDRKQIMTVQPHTQGGLSTYHLASAASTNATVVKTSAGQLYGWYIYNSNAAARKVVFHNTASTPTAGASVLFSIVIPPASGANVEFTNGIAFSSGIAITTVTGLADNDTTAVAVNDLIINLFYK